MRSIYVHIPFCTGKCKYCDFFSVPYGEDLVNSYVHALCREIRLRGDRATGLDTIYIGGGTPTILSDDQIRGIIGAIRDDYEVSHGAEFTVEANPGTFSPAKAGLLVSQGVDRISIGVQSLDDRDLSCLGRAHNARDAVEAVGIARNAGFDAVSLDLIYGIPNQTRDAWKRVVDRALDLRPEHISAYELTPEEDTPFSADLKNGTVAMPDDGVVVQMHETFTQMAEERGYEHYEISNFALPGFRCRHNVNYWKRGDYIGVGAGAHSCEGNVRSSNVRDVRGYIDRISRGLPATEESRELNSDEAVSEYILLGLRMMEGIDLRRLAPERRSAIEKAVEDLHGLAVVKGDILRLTKRGIVLSNEVIVRVM